MNVEIVRNSGGRDRYGDPVTVAEVRIPIPGAIVAPRVAGSGTSSTETTDRDRQGVVIGKTLYLPPDTDIRRSDLIDIDGELYTVEGESGEWQSPYTGRRPGMEVAVRRAEG